MTPLSCVGLSNVGDSSRRVNRPTETCTRGSHSALRREVAWRVVMNGDLCSGMPGAANMMVISCLPRALPSSSLVSILQSLAKEAETGGRRGCLLAGFVSLVFSASAALLALGWLVLGSLEDDIGDSSSSGLFSPPRCCSSHEWKVTHDAFGLSSDPIVFNFND